MSSSVKEETPKTGTEAVKTIINVRVHRSHGGTTGVQLSSLVYGEDINKTGFLCNIMGQEERQGERGDNCCAYKHVVLGDKLDRGH